MQIAGFGISDILAALWPPDSHADRLALYLVWGTVALSGVVTSWQTQKVEGGWRAFFSHCLPPGILTHKSARADFLFWLSRRLFVPLFVVPLGLSTVSAGYASYSLLTLMFGP